LASVFERNAVGPYIRRVHVPGIWPCLLRQSSRLFNRAGFCICY